MENKSKFYIKTPCPAKPFGYWEILKGDKIKRTRTHHDGTVSNTIGVAEKQDAYAWYSAGGAFLAVLHGHSDWEDTYELLERIEPPKDHVVMRNVDNYSSVASNVETLEECLRLKKQWESDCSPRVRTFVYTVVKLVLVDEG
jgi:hypothetical protein